MFCSAVKWTSYYLLPKDHSHGSVKKHHVALVPPDSHISKHRQLHRSRITLAPLMSLSTHQYNSVKPALFYINRCTVAYGWNASLSADIAASRRAMSRNSLQVSSLWQKLPPLNLNTHTQPTMKATLVFQDKALLKESENILIFRNEKVAFPVGNDRVATDSLLSDL